jgi:hypothetical protein
MGSARVAFQMAGSTPRRRGAMRPHVSLDGRAQGRCGYCKIFDIMRLMRQVLCCAHERQPQDIDSYLVGDVNERIYT